MLQIEKALNDATVIVDTENVTPNFENNDDEVDVEAIPVDETDQDIQTLPGQASYLKSEYIKTHMLYLKQVEEITEEKNEREELGDIIDTEASDDSKDLLDDDDDMD